MDITYSDDNFFDDWVISDDLVNQIVVPNPIVNSSKNINDNKDDHGCSVHFNPTIAPKIINDTESRVNHFNQLMSDTDLMIASLNLRIRSEKKRNKEHRFRHLRSATTKIANKAMKVPFIEYHLHPIIECSSPKPDTP